LPDLECGKINGEQHDLSKTLYERPGTTISKPTYARDNRIYYFFLILFLNVYPCMLILSEQKLDRVLPLPTPTMHKVAIAGRINAAICSHQLLVISSIKYYYDVKIQF